MFGLGTIRERLRELDVDVEKLKVTVRELKAQRRQLLAEWLDTYEKFDALYRRTAKRQRDQARKLEQSREDRPGDTNGDPLGVRVNPLALDLLRRR